MTKTQTFVTIAVASAFVMAASAAGAQNISPSVRRSAACAPPVAAESLPDRVLRIVGGQDVSARTLFGAGELVVVDGGTAQGTAVDQQYFIRRSASFGADRNEARRPASTIGWLRIVAVNETTSMARIEVMCDGVLAGDYLEAYAEPALPSGLMKPDTTGEPDFMAAGRVMYGQEERITGAAGDFMMADLGEDDGVVAGARFAIYRDVEVEDVPLVAIGEAVVVNVSEETSLIRITQARDAVRSGDLLVPRRDSAQP
jgi:hypothetical protein